MSEVTVKPTVRFQEDSLALGRLLGVLLQVAASWHEPPDVLTVTAGSDGQHMAGSRHYTGEAIDVRSQSFPSLDAKERFREAYETALGPKFRVLFESVGTNQEHFHAQVARGGAYP